MVKINNVTGVEFCDFADLVNNEEMERLGFSHHEVLGANRKAGRNVSAYFEKEDLPYVYVEAYIAKLNACTKFIIDKQIYEKLGLSNKVVILNTGKGDGTRAVPSVWYDGTTFALHKANHRGVEVDHTSFLLNIITEESLRECKTKQNLKNKKNLYSGSVYCGETTYIKLEETSGVLSAEVISELIDAGYKVKVLKSKVRIEKSFENEQEALRALGRYEKIAYGDFAYNPLNDMRGHFEEKFQQMILGTMTEEDIICSILEDYADDARMIARYNLEQEYESRGIAYNRGKILENGQFVAVEARS